MNQTIDINTNTAAQSASQTGGGLSVINNVNDLADKILNIFNLFIYVIVALAIVFIVYNVVMYMVRGEDPEKKKEAAKSFGWGILGLAIIVSIWGLVNILTNTFRTDDARPDLPNADFVNQRMDIVI